MRCRVPTYEYVRNVEALLYLTKTMPYGYTHKTGISPFMTNAFFSRGIYLPSHPRTSNYVPWNIFELFHTLLTVTSVNLKSYFNGTTFPCNWIDSDRYCRHVVRKHPQNNGFIHVIIVFKFIGPVKKMSETNWMKNESITLISEAFWQNKGNHCGNIERVWGNLY